MLSHGRVGAVIGLVDMAKSSAGYGVVPLSPNTLIPEPAKDAGQAADSGAAALPRLGSAPSPAEAVLVEELDRKTIRRKHAVDSGSVSGCAIL